MPNQPTADRTAYFFQALDEHLADGDSPMYAIRQAVEHYARLFHANTPPAPDLPATRSGENTPKKSAGLTFTFDEANLSALENMTDRDVRTVTASEYAGWQAAFDHANARIAELVRENGDLTEHIEMAERDVKFWKDRVAELESALPVDPLSLSDGQRALAGDAKGPGLDAGRGRENTES